MRDVSGPGRGKLRAAIVGTGLIAVRKHIPAFLREKRAELVALCDLDVAKAGSLAVSHGIPRAYGSVEEMMAAESPDLVSICTPPETHERLALAAIAGGAHVLIEKPMALSVAQCDNIMEAARRQGVQVTVFHSNLFYPPLVRARKLIAQGAIGELRGLRMLLSTPTDYMTSRPNHWVHRMRGDVIAETGPHVVYTVLALLGQVREVSVVARKLMAEYPWSPAEEYRLTFQCAGGIGSAALLYSSDQWMAKMELLGSRGALLLDLENMSLVRYRRPALQPVQVGAAMLREAAHLAFHCVGAGAHVLTGRMPTTHGQILSSFIDNLLHGSRSPVTAEEGRETVRVLNLLIAKAEEQTSALSAV